MDPILRYPCYVDLDPFIDLDRLRALDEPIRERLQRRLHREQDLAFYTGPFILCEDAPSVPGPRMVYLSQSARQEDYYDLDRTELWSLSEEAEDFADLMDFIYTLPFKSRGRSLIIYDEQGRAVTAHRDHDSQDLCHEFIWFRTNLDKPFFMLDPQGGERVDVRSHAAWFDTVNQFHGADATGGLAWSMRVDGVFTDEFRSLIPPQARGTASAAAAWAAALTMKEANAGPRPGNPA